MPFLQWDSVASLKERGVYFSTFLNLDLDLWQVLANEKLENLIETEARPVLEHWGSSRLAILRSSDYRHVNESQLACGRWVRTHPATSIDSEAAIHHQACEWGHQPLIDPKQAGELYQHFSEQRGVILLKPSPRCQLTLQWEKIVSFSH